MATHIGGLAVIRCATPTDRPALETYLDAQRATSMFLSSNLRDHGISGTGHPKATTFWLALEAGEIAGVFGCARNGFLICAAPLFGPSWAGPLRAALTGQRVIGMNGEAGQISTLIGALGLAQVMPSFDDTQSHYRLSLDALIVPDGQTRLRPMAADDLDLIAGWRAQSDSEIFGDGDLPEGRLRSRLRAQELIDTGRGRILGKDGTPVAMTGFNAVMPDMVQIGSVYTPRALRGRGHARRAVALHLAGAANTGVREAILFSSGAAASRAYEAIGFVQIGTYRLIDFDPAVIIGRSS